MCLLSIYQLKGRVGCQNNPDCCPTYQSSKTVVTSVQRANSSDILLVFVGDGAMSQELLTLHGRNIKYL